MEKEFNLSKKFRVWDDHCGRWWCVYNKEELGYIEYWKPWKKWVWNQNQDIIMSKSCLELVIKAIDKLEGDKLTK